MPHAPHFGITLQFRSAPQLSYDHREFLTELHKCYKALPLVSGVARPSVCDAAPLLADKFGLSDKLAREFLTQWLTENF